MSYNDLGLLLGFEHSIFSACTGNALTDRSTSLAHVLVIMYEK